ncbi:MAG: hypothetical protein V3S29_14685, partial [bacterium]
ASVTAAKSNLNGILTSEGNAARALTDWSSITVEATHQLKDGVSDACTAANDVAGLQANCDVVNFTINLQ